MAKDIFLWTNPETGKKTWYANVWDSATRKKIKKAIGPNKREAEDAAARMKQEMKRGGTAFRTKAIALGEFIPRVLNEHFKKRIYYGDACRYLRQFQEFAGPHLPITAVSKSLLSRYVLKRSKDKVQSPYHSNPDWAKEDREWRARTHRCVKSSTINREVAVIKCMMNKALEWDEIAANPLAGFKKESEKKFVRKRFLQLGERRDFLLAVSTLENKKSQDILRLALYIGRRRSEILRLRVQDYDRENGLLYFAKTKEGTPDWVPVPPQAQEILQRLCDGAECDWLFPNKCQTKPVRNIQSAFERVRQRSGIKDFKFHDLRHTAISYMLMAGNDTSTIADLVGHTTSAMIDKVYGHLSRKHKEASTVVYGAYLTRLDGEPQAVTPGQDEQMPVVPQATKVLRGEDEPVNLAAVVAAGSRVPSQLRTHQVVVR
jgi:integrase